jgi:hypothetical protein
MLLGVPVRERLAAALDEVSVQGSFDFAVAWRRGYAQDDRVNSGLEVCPHPGSRSRTVEACQHWRGTGASISRRRFLGYSENIPS